MKRRALLFAGQGVQAPGMDNGLTEREPGVFEEASDALGIDVAALCRTGVSGVADLRSTRWAQPAIVTVGVASARVLDKAGATKDAVAGHSVGEYAALVVSGCLSLGDALRLLTVRAEAMEHASRRTRGGMVAVLGLDAAMLPQVADVWVSAANAPGQVVVSGALEALDVFVEKATADGARCRRLDVAGAFHSPLMAPARDALDEALRDVTFAAPRLPIWSSTTAAPMTDVAQALLAQLTEPVRWRQTLEGLHRIRFDVFCDAGPGQVLAAMVKRTLPEATVEKATDLTGADT